MLGGQGRQRAAHGIFPAVGLLLFSSGFAANHFVSMLPVLYAQSQLPRVAGEAAYGIYALGLLPGLLGGGALADRLGPRGIVLTGASVATLGNLLMAFWHSEPGVLTGRLIVGAGVGLAMSAGTAWAASLRGTSGAALAGILLTSGFASGPIISGAWAAVLPESAMVMVPFLCAAALSAVAVVIGAPVTATTKAGEPATAGGNTQQQSGPSHSGDAPARGLSRALLAALPMALWVFSCVTMAFVVLPVRMDVTVAMDPLLPGMGAALAFSAGLSLQALARRRSWGPVTGVIGAVLACLGFALMGWTADSPVVWQFVVIAVVLGSAYGLCLREGLQDVDRLAPLASRGLVVGVFYVVAYTGFGLPLLLEAIRPSMGAALPSFLIAGLAACMAIIRTIHILSTDHLNR